MYYTIAALLDGRVADLQRQLWDEMTTQTNLVLKLPERRPHLSFFQGEFVANAQLLAVLHQLTDEIRPFFVSLAGLAVFTGENPVIYVNVVKTPALNQLQRMIYERLSPLVSEARPEYNPAYFVPHLTIGWVIESSGTAQAFERLGRHSFNDEFIIDNLTLLSQGEKPVRLDFADA